MNDFYVNAGGCAVHQNLLALCLMRSGLQWEMHSAQLFGLEALALEQATRFDFEVTEEKARSIQELMRDTKHTLMGIPVVTSEEYPKGLIRLMYEGKEVTRIEALAVPCGFGDFTEKELEEERRKFAAIGYRSFKDHTNLETQ